MKLSRLFLPLLFLAVLCFSCSSKSEPELHLYTWADYIKPEIVEKFEKECNCRVTVDTFDSNESMYAKLKVGASGYDLIFPSGYLVDMMQEQEMLLPIDRQEIPNSKYLDASFLTQSNRKIEAYAIPYLLSLSGVAYRNDKVQIEEPTWSVFGKRNYRGRMTMLNDIRETMGAALKRLGYSINTHDQQQVSEAAELLIDWKRNLAKFESEQYKPGIASAEYLIVQGYNGDILQVMQENPRVSFYFPKEGTVIALDYAAIPANAPNPELAKKFINYLLDPAISAENMAFTFFLAPNTGAYELLPDHLKNDPILFPPKEILEKSEVIKNLGESTDMYYKAWDHIKAAG